MVFIYRRYNQTRYFSSHLRLEDEKGQACGKHLQTLTHFVGHFPFHWSKADKDAFDAA